MREVRTKVTNSLNTSGMACPRGAGCRKRGGPITALRWLCGLIFYLHFYEIFSALESGSVYEISPDAA